VKDNVKIEWRTLAEVPNWVRKLLGIKDRQLGYGLKGHDNPSWGGIIVFVDEVAKFSREHVDETLDEEEKEKEYEGAFIWVFCRTLEGVLIEELVHVFETGEEKKAINATLALLRATGVASQDERG